MKKLRLEDSEIRAIKEIATKVFGEKCRVFIFGSRTNLELKGGDIDIFIEVPEIKNVTSKKVEFLVELKEQIGEQKIDLIVATPDCQKPICLEAREKGVEI
ncbi:MAG: nucleotidyltransferase domain-containing protein [Desulfurobacterium sp.]|nr:MAG: nucleotidyltransferase domain-containing protein [Desulfurobacterium sp.]